MRTPWIQVGFMVKVPNLSKKIYPLMEIMVDRPSRSVGMNWEKAMNEMPYTRAFLRSCQSPFARMIGCWTEADEERRSTLGGKSPLAPSCLEIPLHLLDPCA